MNKIISAIVIAIGFALSGFFIGHAISKAKAFDRSVSVKGLAEQTVKSNLAIWQIQFSYADNDLTNLYQGMAAAQNKVKSFLEQQGFKPSSLSIQSISVVDNQSSGYNSNQNIKRYVANGGIVVSSADVDKVSQAIQNTGQLVQEGVVVTSTSVQYLYTELNKIKPAMLVEATKNARLAAESFAKSSSSQLGAIRDAAQGLFTIEDANNSYNTGTSIMKKVRVVTSMQYFLKAD